MEEERVKLYVMGISYSPLQNGAFAMLLAQENGPYRIPIVIGAAEAQSIAIQIEHLVTPRPITHDLFCSLAHAFSIELEEVFIYKFEDGIFSAELTFNNGEREVKLDSRSSDAIAIALRTGAPIYTTKEILLQTGTIFKKEDPDIEENEADDTDGLTHTPQRDYADMSLMQLEQELEKQISDENYEEAAKINEYIKKRKDEGY